MRFLSLVVVLGVSLSARGQDMESIKKEVVEADRAREAAFSQGDGEAWKQYIIDACRWTNLATGEVSQNKAERAANITKRGPAESLKLSGEKFHVGGADGNLVTQTGHYTSAETSQRFARVWQKRDGKWKMAALYTAPE